MASHVAPGYIPGVAHFWVQFSVSCIVSPPPAVRGWLLTRLQKQYNKERERRAMATVPNDINCPIQPKHRTRHPSEPDTPQESGSETTTHLGCIEPVKPHLQSGIQSSQKH